MSHVKHFISFMVLFCLQVPIMKEENWTCYEICLSVHWCSGTIYEKGFV